MPQPKLHINHAARQAAYRGRQQAAYAAALQQKGLPKLPAIPALPGTLRWRKALDSAALILEQTTSEMQDYYDERSETWQESERAEALLELKDQIEACLNTVREIVL